MMDLCDLIYKLRSHYFAKDRDVVLQSDRVFTLGDGTDITASCFVPVGGIILWSGAIAAIPTNWALCNGSNGTPDLRDKFVVGAGSTYAVGATGGAATINIEHAHAGTSGAGSSHSHSSGSYTAGSPASSCYNAVLGTEISMARCAHTLSLLRCLTQHWPAQAVSNLLRR